MICIGVKLCLSVKAKYNIFIIYYKLTMKNSFSHNTWWWPNAVETCRARIWIRRFQVALKTVFYVWTRIKSLCLHTVQIRIVDLYVKTPESLLIGYLCLAWIYCFRLRAWRRLQHLGPKILYRPTRLQVGTTKKNRIKTEIAWNQEI
jgi:hypothetical protein